MGTLLKQEPRMSVSTKDRLYSTGKEIKKLSEKLEISFKDAAKVYEIEMVKEDFDAKDEQLAGFAKRIDDFSYAVDEFLSILKSRIF